MTTYHASNSSSTHAHKGSLHQTHSSLNQVRVESTITESNGSSSMASVCGGCLAMLDAGGCTELVVVCAVSFVPNRVWSRVDCVCLNVCCVQNTCAIAGGHCVLTVCVQTCCLDAGAMHAGGHCLCPGFLRISAQRVCTCSALVCSQLCGPAAACSHPPPP